jgi:hypothetical protein
MYAKDKHRALVSVDNTSCDPTHRPYLNMGLEVIHYTLEAPGPAPDNVTYM